MRFFNFLAAAGASGVGARLFNFLAAASGAAAGRVGARLFISWLPPALVGSAPVCLISWPAPAPPPPYGSVAATRVLGFR